MRISWLAGYDEYFEDRSSCPSKKQSHQNTLISNNICMEFFLKLTTFSCATSAVFRGFRLGSKGSCNDFSPEKIPEVVFALSSSCTKRRLGFGKPVDSSDAEPFTPFSIYKHNSNKIKLLI